LRGNGCSRLFAWPVRALLLAGTDEADAMDLREAEQRGHNGVKTTEIYLLARAGKKVRPTK
jgi:hypothetical protein